MQSKCLQYGLVAQYSKSASADDPLSASTAPTPQGGSIPVSHHPLSSPLINISDMAPQSRPVRQPPKPCSGLSLTPQKSFPNLLRPGNYHPLPSTSVPPPLLHVTTSEDIALLLSSSQFRNGAITAAHKLTSEVSPTDVKQIFELLYVRLACLTLVGQTGIAAQEVKVLGDLTEPAYVDDVSGQSLVPWELKVLAVRLNGIGYGDLRKGVMGYYELAREARTALQKLVQGVITDEAKTQAVRMWEERLEDLGVRVANALVEMGDLAGAAAHLQTLSGHKAMTKRAAFREALLWLKIGDVDRAKAVVATDAEGKGEEYVIDALGQMAEGSYRKAADIWRGLLDIIDKDRKWDGEEMWKVNLAVSLLYSGQIEEVSELTLVSSSTDQANNKQARDIMEATVSCGAVFPALTFNLSTIYELSTDRSRGLKTQLVDKVATFQDTPSLTNADFKL